MELITVKNSLGNSLRNSSLRDDSADSEEEVGVISANALTAEVEVLRLLTSVVLRSATASSAGVTELLGVFELSISGVSVITYSGN